MILLAMHIKGYGVGTHFCQRFFSFIVIFYGNLKLVWNFVEILCVWVAWFFVEQLHWGSGGLLQFMKLVQMITLFIKAYDWRCI